MTAEDSLKRGDLQACLQDLQRLLRKNPGDQKRRISLFELFAVIGAWDKARVQLSILSEMAFDIEAPNTDSFVQTYGQLLRCEAARRDVFRGRRNPRVLGKPEAWVAQMVQALHSLSQGDVEAGMNHRRRALAAAPSSSGVIDGHAFTWIGDSDSRLGPVIEAIIDGRYLWVPFDRVARITLEGPADLRDVVWLPATFTWINGGRSVAFIPARYPESELNADSAIQLGRKTVWQGDDDLTIGLGQRVLATDRDDYPLLDVRSITFARDGQAKKGAKAHG